MSHQKLSLNTLSSLENISTYPKQFEGVHVFWASTSSFLQEKDSFSSLLSVEEKEKMNRFSTESLSWLYEIAHGLLRAFLSHYLTESPLDIPISHTQKGKPFIEQVPLFFNLSHTHEGVLLGFSWESVVGVDVEYTARPHLDALSIAKRYFHPREYEKLISLPPKKQDFAFYRVWTQKEALLKATGEGIAEHLGQYEMSCLPKESPALLFSENKKIDPSQWHLSLFEPAPSYLGAVAFCDDTLC